MDAIDSMVTFIAPLPTIIILLSSVGALVCSPISTSYHFNGEYLVPLLKILSYP